MLGRELNFRTYPEIGITEGHHGLSHHGDNPGQIEKLAKLNTYQAELFAWFLEKLRTTPDADGSLNLNISEAPSQTVPVRGRMLDHIGFEISGLEAFCRSLTAKGITFDVPHRKNADGVATAVLTDSWGTSIELTEGLRVR